MAMQHSGEDAGGYAVEGMINYLLSDDINAQKIRNDFVYYFISMMNPDGVFHGVSRYTSNMQDLNDEWIRNISEELEMPMEVEFVQKWIMDQYKRNKTIDLFIDIHCHLQKNRNIAFLDKSKERENLKNLTNIMNKYWPNVRYSYNNSAGRLAGNFAAQLNIPSLTVEFTQSYESEGSGKYLEIDDYRLFGEDMVKTITENFNN